MTHGASQSVKPLNTAPQISGKSTALNQLEFEVSAGIRCGSEWKGGRVGLGRCRPQIWGVAIMECVRIASSPLYASYLCQRLECWELYGSVFEQQISYKIFRTVSKGRALCKFPASGFPAYHLPCTIPAPASVCCYPEVEIGTTFSTQCLTELRWLHVNFLSQSTRPY
jgi:hypothetical protein